MEECYRALTNTASLEKQDTICGSSHVPLPRDRNPCEHQVSTSTRLTRRSYCSLVKPTMGIGFALSLCVAIRKQFTRNVLKWVLLRSCEILKTSVDKEYQPFHKRSLPVPRKTSKPQRTIGRASSSQLWRCTRCQHHVPEGWHTGFHAHRL